MAKPRRRTKGGAQTWEAQLARDARAGCNDGAARLAVLVASVGLDRAPAMTLIIKRPPRRAAAPTRSSPELQQVDRYAYLQEDFASMLIAV